VAEHGAHRASAGASASKVDDAAVPRRVFLVVGVLVAAIAVLYWFTAYEDAGTVLLALSAVLALWYGVFLWLQARQRHGGQADEVDEPHYLPHASVWPFAIGLGIALVLNGIVLGIWVVVPGVGLTALGTAGFVLQTRRRD
jgi:hypothetical protein